MSSSGSAWRPSHRIMRFAKFILPIALAAFYGLLLFLMLDWETFKVVGGGMFIYLLPPLGKESIIPGMVALGVHPAFVAMNIALVDIFAGIWLVWNFDLFQKIPGVGLVIVRIQKKTLSTLNAHPWMNDLVFVGIVVSIIVPFQGSGAVASSIFGNILSLKPEKVLLAIEIGAVISAFIFAYMSHFIISLLVADLFCGVAALAVVVLVLVWSRTASAGRMRAALGSRLISRTGRGGRDAGQRSQGRTGGRPASHRLRTERGTKGGSK